ncbi:MAG: ABC transporter ATP-binding protein [Rhizobiaceae bacterium MnEN-MB40S]|nr:MAG: ABC transporter ATP-binding protein [Rhizobiaceae bacterium MnEN-MB40S]
MRSLLPIIRRIWTNDWWSVLRGAALSVTVLVAGIALLGLSGWFIAAAGVAGLAGAGVVFDVFRPSAGVRFLALGRTAARYGERILTHDATLRSLARLRVDLLSALSTVPFPRLPALRASEQLTRLTRDVDALDGVALRLVIPLVAAAATLMISAVALWFLVDPALVVWLLASTIAGILPALGLVAVRSRKPSRLSQLALNAFRMRFMDLIQSRAELMIFGKLDRRAEHVMGAEQRMRKELARNDRIERAGGFLISSAESLTAAGALLIGGLLARAAVIDPALAALGFLATLAIAEALAPLRRGLAEIGRMTDAARRVNRLLDAGKPQAAPARSLTHQKSNAPLLQFKDACFSYREEGPLLVADFNLQVASGETVALTGASGSGKSTILQLAASMMQPTHGTVAILGSDLRDWEEPRLRETVSLLPQRSALLSGAIRDGLAVARPGLNDEYAWAVLTAVALDDVIEARGGLDSRLGESGTGLSGGESRRLALARVLLRRPALLLLDEPTEGLDRDTATRALAGIRKYLPETGILLASHREAELVFSDRQQDVALRCEN